MYLQSNFSLLGRSAVNMPQTLNDYKAIYGLTEEDMSKALSIDSNLGDSVTPVIGESLDPVVHYITLNSANFAPTLRRWKTYQARAHLEQFALVSSLGKSRWGGSAHAEGDLGTQDSSKFERVTENQRWFGQVGVVTRTAQRASAAKFGDLKKREGFGRLTKLLLDGEVNIWHGDPALNPYMFSGLIPKIKGISNNQNVVSLRTTGVAGSRETYTGGGTLSLAQIRTYMESSLRYGGIHTACFMAPAEKVAISNTEMANMRWNDLGKGASRVEGGLTVDQIDNPLGPPCDIVWSVWFKNGGRIDPYIEFDPADATQFHPNAPARMAAPTVAVISPSASGKLPADTYYYAVAAISKEAEGPVGIETTGAAADNSNGSIGITVTHGADVGNVLSYALYRSTTLPTSADDYANMRFVKEVAVASGAVPGGTQLITDDGTIIPGSRYACLVDESAMSLPELLPPSIRDLADVDNTHRFSLDWEFSPLAHDKGLREVLFTEVGGSVADS